MGFLPELKVDGEIFAQTTPMLNYISKIGKMDRLNPTEEFKSGMVFGTSNDCFVSSVRPAYVLLGINMTEKTGLDKFKEAPKDEHRTIFRNKTIEGLKANFPKVEFVLKHLGAKDSLLPGKITIGDLTILALFMASQYFEIEDVFKTLMPSAQPIFENLMKNPFLANQVEKGKAVPFCPY